MGWYSSSFIRFPDTSECCNSPATCYYHTSVHAVYSGGGDTVLNVIALPSVCSCSLPILLCLNSTPRSFHSLVITMTPSSCSPNGVNTSPALVCVVVVDVQQVLLPCLNATSVSIELIGKSWTLMAMSPSTWLGSLCHPPWTSDLMSPLLSVV